MIHWTISTLEYGFEGLVSTGSDIYSYGSMLIEVFARLKPIDEMFSDTCLRNWVKSCVPTAYCSISGSRCKLAQARLSTLCWKVGGHNVYCENSYSLHRRFSQGQDECYRCSCFSRIARQPRKLFTQNKEIHILEIDFMSILRNWLLPLWQIFLFSLTSYIIILLLQCMTKKLELGSYVSTHLLFFLICSPSTLLTWTNSVSPASECGTMRHITLSPCEHGGHWFIIIPSMISWYMLFSISGPSTSRFVTINLTRVMQTSCNSSEYSSKVGLDKCKSSTPL